MIKIPVCFYYSNESVKAEIIRCPAGAYFVVTGEWIVFLLFYRAFKVEIKVQSLESISAG